MTLIGQNIEGFQNSWNMVLQALPTVPNDEIVLHAHKTQVKLFKPLAEDFAHFEPAEKGSPDGTYEWLYNAVQRYIRRTQQDIMQKALTKGISHGANPVPGLAGEDKGKGKGKEKKKMGEEEGKRGEGEGGGMERERKKEGVGEGEREGERKKDR
mgnify:CR=1 FL=1